MADESFSEITALHSAGNIGSALDMDAVRQLKELESDDAPGFFSNLVHEFEREGAELMAALQASIERSDVVALRNAAHSLKGASATIGAVELSAVCERACECARANDIHCAKALLPQLEIEWRRALQALHECSGENL